MCGIMSMSTIQWHCNVNLPDKPPPVCRALFRALAGRGRFPSGGDLNSTQEFGAGSLAIALPTQGTSKLPEIIIPIL